MPITDDVPLPRGSAVIGEHNGYAIYRWTADDVRAYGDARAAAATERAAKVCDEHASIEGIAQACAAAIGQSQT